MTEAENAFLQATALPAIATQREYGVPASITLAQAILESGWGETELARQANNYFGIKTRDPEQYVEFETAEYVKGQRVTVVANFARYATVDAGFLAHAQLLALAARYQPAMNVRRDPALFAEQLQKCGYSTNPNYAAELMQLVREFHLTQYDAVANGPQRDLA